MRFPRLFIILLALRFSIIYIAVSSHTVRIALVALIRVFYKCVYARWLQFSYSYVDCDARVVSISIVKNYLICLSFIFPIVQRKKKHLQLCPRRYSPHQMKMFLLCSYHCSYFSRLDHFYHYSHHL